MQPLFFITTHASSLSPLAPLFGSPSQNLKIKYLKNYILILEKKLNYENETVELSIA
jgi:hypothetical protein